VASSLRAVTVLAVTTRVDVMLLSTFLAVTLAGLALVCNATASGPGAQTPQLTCAKGERVLLNPKTGRVLYIGRGLQGSAFGRTNGATALALNPESGAVLYVLRRAPGCFTS
jgi:hypothetical protein